MRLFPLLLSARESPVDVLVAEMKQSDVPQDQGLLGGLKEVKYALNGEGRFVLVKSDGWDAATAANLQSWDAVIEDVAAAQLEVRSGKRSPLTVFLEARMMTVALLADYAGFGRLRIWWRTRPLGFSRMPEGERLAYEKALALPQGALGKESARTNCLDERYMIQDVMGVPVAD